MSNTKEIIKRYFGQDPSEDIRRKFFLWLQSPVASAKKEEILSELWDDLSIPADSLTERSYRQVGERLGFTKRNQRKILYMRIAHIAAVVLIPLLSILTVWLYVHNQRDSEIALIEHYVPHGEIREIILPDNSRVLVNSGSVLFYPKDFNGRTRDIYLSGEAKFTVSPNPEKPFIVRTNDMVVEALGTVFNVSSFPDNSHTTATLVEGKIGVDLKFMEKTFILNPNEQLIYDRETGESQLKEVRVDYVLAWEKGQMIFYSASLHAIIEELERHYGVTVYLNTMGFRDEKLTVKFLYNETLEEVLDALQHIISGFKCKIEGDKVYIY